MADRSGIEIDYCPDCRGVWLDRGELDKIIERTTPNQALQPAQPAPSRPHRNDAAPTDTRPPRRDRDDDFEYDDRDDEDRRRHPGQIGDGRPLGRRRKKGGFLGELFDF
jgi:Zn-finger nucleic acid-binding protein